MVLKTGAVRGNQDFFEHDFTMGSMSIIFLVINLSFLVPKHGIPVTGNG
jgi:hypothetical protein